MKLPKIFRVLLSLVSLVGSGLVIAFILLVFFIQVSGGTERHSYDGFLGLIGYLFRTLYSLAFWEFALAFSVSVIVMIGSVFSLFARR